MRASLGAGRHGKRRHASSPHLPRVDLVRDDGSRTLALAPSRPGDRIVFRCLVDVVAAVSSCPMDLVPINGARITSLELVVGPDAA